MEPLLALLLVVALARLLGEVAVRLNQSPMLGEILAGLLLGPTALALVEPDEALELLSRLGILFLMFLAGLETDIRLIRKVAGPSFLVSFFGQAFALGLGLGVGLLFGLSFVASLFLGAALSGSSIVVTARVLDDYGAMTSEVGLLSLAANAVDDVMSVFVLLLLASVVGDQGQEPFYWTLGKMAVYVAVAVAVGLWLFRPLMRIVGRLRSDEMFFSVAVILVLVFSWSAEAFGLADVLGAFIVGAFLHYTEEAEPSMIRRVEAVSAGFLVPVFFAGIGLQTDLRELGGAYALLAVAFVAAVVSKLGGCGLGARVAGYGWLRSYIVGAGMVPRAEMTLVFLGIGLSAGVLPETLPPVVVALVFLTAIVTSPLLRLGLRAGPGGLGPSVPARGPHGRSTSAGQSSRAA